LGQDALAEFVEVYDRSELSPFFQIKIIFAFEEGRRASMPFYLFSGFWPLS